jgi:PAS domain S-box-containing protein
MEESGQLSLRACHAPAYGLHDGGRVLEVSGELARMFGYGPPEVAVGRDALTFIAPDYRDAAVQAALSEPGKPVRTRGLRADGTSFPIEVSTLRVRYQGKIARLFLVRDISPVAVVVDDDSIVKNLLAALMRMAGYQAYPFQQPEEVIQEFVPGIVSVLVTDIQMPGRNGIDLVKELRKVDPELPALFVSGFSHSRVPSGDEMTQFLQKPFGLKDLKEALRRLPKRAWSDLP